jgi:vacuole morphology and inheritance protein 14
MHLLQLERPDNAALLRALHGLLMLLPQSTAFHTLRDRLAAVTALHSSLAAGAGRAGAGTAMGLGSGAEGDELVAWFDRVLALPPPGAPGGAGSSSG